MNSTKNLFKKYFISTKNLNFQELNEIFSTSLFMKKNKNIHNYNNKILVNAFFEPSTRTSLSFESAMYRLGGKVITFNKDVSSLKKGESIYDTLKTLENYGDIIAIRHPDKNLIDDITNSDFLKIPIINGGNGSGEHPTQALLDLFTIQESFDLNKSLHIGFTGDLKNSRTIHSLVYLLNKINKNITYFWLCDCKLLPQGDFLEFIENNIPENKKFLCDDFKDINNFFSIIDVLYMTRLQKERHKNDQEIFEYVKIDRNFLNITNFKGIIMHPLPRNDEISTDIDEYEKSKYFQQMENGVYIRMSIIDNIIKNL